jgi:hypothetical protein
MYQIAVKRANLDHLQLRGPTTSGIPSRPGWKTPASRLG